MTASEPDLTPEREPNLEWLSSAYSTVVPEVISLGRFLESGRPPQVSDATIIALFADVRGFTEYCSKLQDRDQDHRIQAFLQEFYEMFVREVLTHRAAYSKMMSQRQADRAEILRFLRPAAFKRLGDGMMIIWEATGAPSRVKHNLALSLFALAAALDQTFRTTVLRVPQRPDETDPESSSAKLRTRDGEEEHRNARLLFGDEAQELRLGVGLAMGHAWRLDFGSGDLDYAGSVVNLASRLCDLARPGGLVASRDLMPAVLDEMSKNGSGRIARVAPEHVHGFPAGVEVLCAADITDARIGDGSELKAP